MERGSATNSVAGAQTGRRRRGSVVEYTKTLRNDGKDVTRRKTDDDALSALRRRNSAPPAGAAGLGRNGVSTLLNCSTDSTKVTRVMYHFAREHLHAVKQTDVQENPKSRCRRAFRAMHYASRAVILSSSVVNIWLDRMAERRLFDAEQAELAWQALRRYSPEGEDNEEQEKLISGLLDDMLQGIQQKEGLRNAGVKVLVGLKEAEASLRRLHASYVVQLQSLEDLQEEIATCAKQAMERVAIFENALYDLQSCLHETPVLDTLVNAMDECDSDGGNLSFHENQAAKRSLILSNLQKDFCDTPRALLREVAQDVMSSHVASGMPSLPCISEVADRVSSITGDGPETCSAVAPSPGASSVPPGNSRKRQDWNTRLLSEDLFRVLGEPLAPLDASHSKRHRSVIHQASLGIIALRQMSKHRSSLPVFPMRDLQGTESTIRGKMQVVSEGATFAEHGQAGAQSWDAEVQQPHAELRQESQGAWEPDMEEEPCRGKSSLLQDEGGREEGSSAKGEIQQSKVDHDEQEAGAQAAALAVAAIIATASAAAGRAGKKVCDPIGGQCDALSHAGHASSSSSAQHVSPPYHQAKKAPGAQNPKEVNNGPCRNFSFETASSDVLSNRTIARIESRPDLGSLRPTLLTSKPAFGDARCDDFSMSVAGRNIEGQRGMCEQHSGKVHNTDHNEEAASDTEENRLRRGHGTTLPACSTSLTSRGLTNLRLEPDSKPLRPPRHWHAAFAASTYPMVKLPCIRQGVSNSTSMLGLLGVRGSKAARDPPIRVRSLPLLPGHASSQNGGQVQSQLAQKFADQQRSGIWRRSAVPESPSRRGAVTESPVRSARKSPAVSRSTSKGILSPSAARPPSPAAALPCLLLRQRAVADLRQKLQMQSSSSSPLFSATQDFLPQATEGDSKRTPVFCGISRTQPKNAASEHARTRETGRCEERPGGTQFKFKSSSLLIGSSSRSNSQSSVAGRGGRRRGF